MALASSLDSISKSDIVSKSSLASQFASISIADVIISILAAFLIGGIIALVYRKIYHGVLYNPSFPITLIMLTLITTPVVMCIKSDIALSMGMVGALSIVRFRTAVKDPLDTAYMFWALTMGILLGAGLYIIALAVVFVLSVFVFVLSLITLKNPNSYLLVIHAQSNTSNEIEDALSNLVKQYKVRSKTITNAGAELTYEVRLNANEDNVVTSLKNIPRIYDVTLVACQTEAGS